ncbi:MAG: penicillin-binding protein 2 [Pseudomonadota bacterium]
MRWTQCVIDSDSRSGDGVKRQLRRMRERVRAARQRPVDAASLALARRQVDRRLWQVAGLMMLAMLLILLRFAYLQLAEHVAFAARAESNRVELQALAPNRGLIVDRNGRVLAENRAAYRLVAVPERVDDADAMLARIDQLVGLSEDELQRYREGLNRSRRFQPVLLKSNLNEQAVATLALHRHQLQGLEVEPYLVRHYPFGSALAHVVGYVARINEMDLQRLPADNYRASTHTGRIGIERQYESLLHGQSGVERVETNAQGRVIRVLERTDPVPGQAIQLSLDIELQLRAIEAMGDYTGAVVIMDVSTGEVLALVSQPGFDPNRFVNGIGQKDYRALLDSPRRPLFNRFLSGGYEPGSTIKPFIAMAGLEQGTITPETEVFSNGEYQLPGYSRKYRDYLEGGHGWVDLRASLEESVNVYFYQLAVDLGIDLISRELALFGFGQVTGIDLPSEYAGVLPSRRWKQATLNEPWYPGETVITGIGQGFTVVTPLQLAYATAAMAGRGLTAPPRLVDLQAPIQLIEHRTANWTAVHAGMRAVIEGPRGTARAIAEQISVPVAGKTGTAQVFGRPQNEEAIPADELPEFLRNHALFIGFAPLQEPQIAIAVVVEHGGGGSTVAAPVAADILSLAMEDQ